MVHEYVLMVYVIVPTIGSSRYGVVQGSTPMYIPSYSLLLGSNIEYRPAEDDHGTKRGTDIGSMPYLTRSSLLPVPVLDTPVRSATRTHARVIGTCLT